MCRNPCFDFPRLRNARSGKTDNGGGHSNSTRRFRRARQMILKIVRRPEHTLGQHATRAYQAVGGNAKLDLERVFAFH